MRRIWRFLWKSWLALIAIFLAVSWLSCYLSVSMIPRPKGNDLLLGLWQAAGFLWHPLLFIVAAMVILVLWIGLFAASDDGRKLLAEIWQQSA